MWFPAVRRSHSRAQPTVVRSHTSQLNIMASITGYLRLMADPSHLPHLGMSGGDAAGGACPVHCQSID